jgi:membrane carboxypeptidase/penicillin-binding protein
MIDNGGHWLLPSVVDAVQDRSGRVIYQKGVKECVACFVATAPASDAAADSLYKVSGAPDPSSVTVPNARYVENAVLYKPTKPDPLISADADAEIIAMMQGVVERGTGTAVAAVGKPLAGKTGTTSDWFDAWFVGFSPDIAAGVYVGFDDPRTLGNGEVGGRVAAPIFRDFMMAALKNVPAKPFPTPPSAAAAVAVNVMRGGPDSADATANDMRGTGFADQQAMLRDGDAQSGNWRPPIDDQGRVDQGRVDQGRDQGRVDQGRIDQGRVDQGQNPYWPPVPRAYGAPYQGAYGAPYQGGYAQGAYGSTYSPGYPAPYRPDYSYVPLRDYNAMPGGYPAPPVRGYPAAPVRVIRPGGGTGGLY